MTIDLSMSELIMIKYHEQNTNAAKIKIVFMIISLVFFVDVSTCLICKRPYRNFAADGSTDLVV